MTINFHYTLLSLSMATEYTNHCKYAYIHYSTRIQPTWTKLVTKQHIGDAGMLIMLNLYPYCGMNRSYCTKKKFLQVNFMLSGVNVSACFADLPILDLTLSMKQ
jgi:hypothetical protein